MANQKLWLKTALKDVREAIDDEFGEHYAIKNPNLVAAIIGFIPQVEYKICPSCRLNVGVYEKVCSYCAGILS